MRTSRNDSEFLRSPEEFPAPAAQMTQPPPEFGSGGEGTPSAKKKNRYHWLAAALAAGLLSTVAMFSESEEDMLSLIAPQAVVSVTAEATATPAPTPDHTPSPSPAPTGPRLTPVPTASPKPTPAPATAPAARLTFYRTSQVYHGFVTLEGQDRMSAVTVRLWDRVLEETVWEDALPAEEIARGWYAVPEFDLGASEFAQKHWDQLMAGYEPDPILEVICTVQTEEGERTFTEQAEAADELWISARYDLKDPNEDFLYSFMEQTTYPDCFVVRIDLSPYGNVNMAYGENAALQPGDVSVTLSVNGQTLSGDGWRLEKTETAYEEGTFYACALVIPRPSSLPEHGAVEIRILRKLIHFPAETITDIHTIEY